MASRGSAGRPTGTDQHRRGDPSEHHFFPSDWTSGEWDLVYRNVTTVARNYLQWHRCIIVSGLIFTMEKAGAIDRLRQEAEAGGATFLDFYCWAPITTVLERNRARRKDVPEEWVARWWHEVEEDRQNVAWPLVELDMRREIPLLVRQVLDAVAAVRSRADAPG